MPMTFRPDDSLAEDLRVQAEIEGRPQAAIVADATRQYIDRTRLDTVIADTSKRLAVKYREALDRLGS